MIQLLSRRPGKRVDELGRILQVSNRSVYRYLKDLEQEGFSVDIDLRHRYFLFEGQHGIREGIRFEPEEIAVMRDLLMNVPGSDGIMAGILLKFSTHQNLSYTRRVSPACLNPIVLLRQALIDQKKVILRQYRSGNSNEIRDRLVSPLSLSEAGSILLAFEESSQQQKSFKLSRIDEVQILEDICSYQDTYQEPDVFGWSGPEALEVEIWLSLRAYNHLIEDYWGADRYVERTHVKPYPYCFRASVRHFDGVGRFLLGLPGEVKIVQPVELRDYLSEKIRLGWG